MDAVKFVELLSDEECLEVFRALSKRIHENKPIEGVYTPLIPWLMKHRATMSSKLFDVLRIKSDFKCLEEITQPALMRFRGIGLKSWEEFVKHRGY